MELKELVEVAKRNRSNRPTDLKSVEQKVKYEIYLAEATIGAIDRFLLEHDGPQPPGIDLFADLRREREVQQDGLQHLRELQAEFTS
jgi:hypothetical protein